MVRKASSASIAIKKGKQALNKNKKRNHDPNKKKGALKSKIQDAMNECLKCKQTVPVSAVNK